MSDDADALLAEARQRLQELEAIEPDELGERVDLEPGGHFVGRWRGEATMRTKGGEAVSVYALWDQDGKPRFAYKHAALVAEIEENRPEIGDEIVIVRGEDREFEAQGEQRRMYRYAARVRPSSEPLPGQAAPTRSQLAADEDLPF